MRKLQNTLYIAAAFVRLCVETQAWFCYSVPNDSSRLRAAVC